MSFEALSHTRGRLWGALAPIAAVIGVLVAAAPALASHPPGAKTGIVTISGLAGNTTNNYAYVHYQAVKVGTGPNKYPADYGWARGQYEYDAPFTYQGTQINLREKFLCSWLAWNVRYVNGDDPNAPAGADASFACRALHYRDEGLKNGKPQNVLRDVLNVKFYFREQRGSDPGWIGIVVDPNYAANKRRIDRQTRPASSSSPVVIAYQNPGPF